MLLFVFLARNKGKDLKRVREISNYLVGLNVATTLLIFPEGTDLSPSNHEKSLQFAKKEGLPEYQYVLHPKVRRFLCKTPPCLFCRAFGPIETLHCHSHRRQHSMGSVVLTCFVLLCLHCHCSTGYDSRGIRPLRLHLVISYSCAIACG